MKKTARKICRITLAVFAIALLGGCLYLNRLMPIITGYAAKNLASAVFISGREPADIEALDLNFSFIRFTRNRVDFEKREVTSRFLWSKSKAVFRDGFGVTLLRGRGKDALLARTWPLANDDAGSPALPRGDSVLTARMEPIARSLVDERAYNGNPFAFVVLHQGGVVAERYGKGIGPDTRLLSWSMAKSFTNALVGLMAGDGMVDIYAPLDIPEWQQDDRRTITLNDLMQMQSGLEWNEDYGNRSDVNLMLHCETDMGGFAQSKPLQYKPGTHWYYSSGSTNIVMRWLRGRFDSDEDFLTYLHDRLFAPLSIHNPYFESDISGTPVGSSYLYATARDFARFGQMYLEDGCIGGKRVLPEGWVDYSVTPASDSKGGYGAFFWLNRDKSFTDVPEDLFSCIGHDGQRIYMIPSKELVVVVLSCSHLPDNMIDFDRLMKDVIAQIH